MKIRSTVILLLLAIVLRSQDTLNLEDMFVRKDFLILQSTKDYQAALATAKNVSLSMKMTLDLRSLAPNKESGLTFSKAACQKDEIDYPSYFARGREDGIYVSIEYSDAYPAFAKGYYIVVAASGSKDELDMQVTYKKIKAYKKDAYFKSSKVYMGCMH